MVERKIGRAEAMFREAFQRLKAGRPQNIPRGSKVTQNNVAKEAGVDKSALRTRRYPELCAEIAQWAAEHPDESLSERQQTIKRRKKARGIEERLRAVTKERDRAAFRLVEAERAIIHLTRQVKHLESLLPDQHANVSPLRRDSKL